MIRSLSNIKYLFCFASFQGCLTLSLAFPLLGGCSTFVTSKKAEEMSGSLGSDGNQYYLPMPIVSVTPKIDGTVQIEHTYWADPNQKFAITGSTFLGKYNLKVVKSEMGILEVVDLSGTSTTELTKSVTGTAAEIAQKRFDAKESERKAQKTEKDTRATAIATAQTKLLEEQNLLTEYERLKLDKDTIKVQQIAVAKAQAKLDSLLGQSVALEEGVLAGAVLLDGQIGAGGINRLPDRMAWGPVYYRVALARDDAGVLTQVKLDPIRFPSGASPLTLVPQRQFASVNVSDSISRPAEIIEGPKKFKNKVSMTIRLPSGIKFDNLVAGKGRVFSANGKEEWFVKLNSFGLETDKAVISTSTSLPKGKYSLLLLQKEGRPIIVEFTMS